MQITFSVLQQYREEIVKKFEANLEKKDINECWIWTGSKSQDGYGQLRYKKLTQYVHRFSWMIHYNCDIPKGLLCMHTCDQRDCGNYTHIMLGTHKSNMQDAKNKDRKSKIKFVDRCKAIERLIAGEGHIKIARSLGVGKSTIGRYAQSEKIIARYGKLNLRHRWKGKFPPQMRKLTTQ